MFKKLLATILTVIFLTPSTLVFADRGRDRFRGDFHREIVVHRLPPGYISLLVGGLAYLYCEGLFYRYTPAGYIVVTPPAGAVIPTLPVGYTTVVSNGMPYYYYGYTYYISAPNGYAVAATPVAPQIPTQAPVAPLPAMPTSLPAPAAAAQPAATVTTSPAKTEGNNDAFEIYIPNGNGSYTSVTLRKTEKGFLGPQGEFYQDHPTVEQLRERYTKK